jgi:hypothetical protein
MLIKDLTRPFASITYGADKWASYDPKLKTIYISEELMLNYPWHVVTSFAIREFVDHVVRDSPGILKGYNEVKNHADGIRVIANKFFKVDPFYLTDTAEIKELTPDPMAKIMDYDADPDIMELISTVKSKFLTATPEEDLGDILFDAIPRIAKSDIRLKNQSSAHGEFCFSVLPLRTMDVNGLIKNIADILLANFPVYLIFINSYDSHKSVLSMDLEFNGRVKDVIITELLFQYMRHSAEMVWFKVKKLQRLSDDPIRYDIYKNFLSSFEAIIQGKGKDGTRKLDLDSIRKSKAVGLEDFVNTHHIAITHRTRIRTPYFNGDR